MISNCSFLAPTIQLSSHGLATVCLVFLALVITGDSPRKNVDKNCPVFFVNLGCSEESSMIHNAKKWKKRKFDTIHKLSYWYYEDHSTIWVWQIESKIWKCRYKIQFFMIAVVENYLSENLFTWYIIMCRLHWLYMDRYPRESADAKMRKKLLYSVAKNKQRIRIGL